MKSGVFIAVGVLVLLGLGWGGLKIYDVNRFGEPDLANGKLKYQANCLVCHGDKGLGDGPGGQVLAVSPDNIYEELSNPFGMKMELISSVIDGDNGQQGVMPAFRDVLSAKDVDDIFEYIRDINEGYGTSESVPDI